MPEVASRQHILSIYPIVEDALNKAHVSISEVDAIAVTRGPGLPGSLIVGVNFAKGLAIGNNLPIIGVNHLEAHLYSAWLYDPNVHENPPIEPRFPLLGLIVSGGHTELVLMNGHLSYERLGGTLDDAAGEAFDKVARLLGLSYPGGPAIQSSAENRMGDDSKDFPRAWLEGTWDFSFSGLKTAVLRDVRNLEEHGHEIPVEEFAAKFQESVVDVLVTKTLSAAEEFGVGEIIVAGGVSANRHLRETLLSESRLPVHVPDINLCTDNAAMIAGVGCFRFQAGQRDLLDMDVLPTWPLSEL